MAELNQNEPRLTTKKTQANLPAGKRGKHSTRMDMTPMVDLAFLLLTFFMLTTTFHKTRTILLTMPVTQGGMPVNPAITILVGKNGQLTYYKDVFNANNPAMFHRTNFTKDGIRKILMDANQPLIQKISEIEDDYTRHVINDSVYHERINAEKKNRSNQGIFVIIKATDEASYESIVLLLDEMKICNVVNYAIVDISKEEEKVLGG
jgi:biopolymer transport protein ExbD